MSFANPQHLSGKQLENFNNTQKALQNITNSQQQQETNQFGGIRPGFQKQVSFNVEQNSKISSIQQSHESSFLSNNQQKKQEPFFGGGAQNNPQFGQNNQILNNGNRNEMFNNQMNFKRKGESINDLVQQSDQTLKQLEDQFKSLNLGKDFKMNNNQNNYKENNQNSNFSKKGFIQQGTGGSNIQSLISDVDKIIQQAQQQTKQLTSNDDGIFRLQNNNYNPYENKGRGFPNVYRGSSKSPSKKKQSRKKSKSKQRKRNKKNKRKNSNSDDDTSSYSGESDSIIQEQEDESHFDDSSFDENYRDDDHQNFDKHSKLQSKKKFSKMSNNKRNNYYKNDVNDAKSISNVSRARSNQSKNNQQNNKNNNGLQKSHLKSLPCTGGYNNEPSVYSSASRTKSNQQQISHQNQIGGFRRCPDESEDNANFNRNNKNSDDSFDINEDFNIVGGGESGKMFSSNQNRNIKQVNVQRKQQNQGNLDDENNRYSQRNQDDNQDDIYLMNRYQSQKELSVASNLQKGIQNQRQQLHQMQINADDDNLIFCINCEEYIKADKVDEHSNICEPVKDDRFMNLNQVVQKINEKLVKIRFLIKNKNSHITNQPITHNQQQIIVGIYEQILEIISVCIENNTNIQLLQEAENDIRIINNQLNKNNHSSSHYLLYLTQKVIEFVQRKYEFIGRYGDNKYNEISDEFSEQDNNFNMNRNNDQYKYNNNQRDLNNIDSISIASSNFNKQNSNNQHQKFQNNQNNRKDPLKIFSKIDENLQNLNPSQSKSAQSKIQGLPPRQPIVNNQRNNIFSQDSSPLKAAQSLQPYQPQNKDIFQSPSTNYSPKVIYQSPGVQQYAQNQQQGSYGRDNNYNNQTHQYQQNHNVNYNSVQPFSIAPRYDQSNQINSGPIYSKPNEDYNNNQNNKKNIFSELPLSAIQVQGRQITNQSEKSQDNNEYIYKGQTQKQNMGNQNMNQMMPVQTVSIKESQITKAQQNNNNNYNTQNMNNNYNNQRFDNFNEISPYKLQSPYKANFNEDKQQSVQKQKFFLMANNLKQKYPQSQLYLISDLWKEVLDQQIQERDWERYLINKFQS